MAISRESTWTDRRRLRRLAEGDASALEEVYDAHAKRIFGLALWITRRREEAEDVVQSVMVKLAEMGADLLSVRRLDSYLLQMARHEALDAARRRGARAEEPIEEALLVTGPGDPEGAPDVVDAGRMLARLDGAQREVVYLHLYEGMTFREVGRITGVSTFTAASRYRLAIERLRREMEKS
jgi:RNA polymerase sigma factor (sigma-70 family)